MKSNIIETERIETARCSNKAGEYFFLYFREIKNIVAYRYHYHCIYFFLNKAPCLYNYVCIYKFIYVGYSWQKGWTELVEKDGPNWLKRMDRIG